MRNTCLRLALVALPALFAASCGGDLFGPLDGGSGDLAAVGSCPQGTGTIFRLADSFYPAVTGSASFVQDTCNTGIAASALESMRKISNDGAGNITIYSSDGSTVQGQGPIRCNGGTLTYGSATTPVISDGVCRFVANYSTDIKITADNTFNLTVTQTRSNPMSEVGQTCRQTNPCTVKYQVSHKL
jgi:hypothetical protein